MAIVARERAAIERARSFLAPGTEPGARVEDFMIPGACSGRSGLRRSHSRPANGIRFRREQEIDPIATASDDLLQKDLKNVYRNVSVTLYALQW